MRAITILLLAALTVAAGCGVLDRKRATPEAALPFRAKARPEARLSRDFTVVARARGAALSETRETLRFHGVGYCILTFGKSDIDWTIDPATGDWAYRRLARGDVAVSGRCDAR